MIVYYYDHIISIMVEVNYSFTEIGFSMMNTNLSASKKIVNRKFSSWFGVLPTICSNLWSVVLRHRWVKRNVCRPNPEHLLWTLHFLFCYGSEENNSARCGTNERTFRKWVWFYSEVIADCDKKFVS